MPLPVVTSQQVAVLELTHALLGFAQTSPTMTMRGRGTSYELVDREESAATKKWSKIAVWLVLISGIVG